MLRNPSEFPLFFFLLFLVISIDTRLFEMFQEALSILRLYYTMRWFCVLVTSKIKDARENARKKY